MDGTTEPLLAVVGHPIAGNPSQFALERAISSLGLDWRVLSFDVPPGDISAALNGFLVTGIAGVLVVSSVREAASAWYVEKTGFEGIAIDCLVRGDEGQFVGSDERRAWLLDQLAEKENSTRLCFGNCGAQTEWDAKFLGTEKIAGNIKSDTIEAADVILVVDDLSGPPELELDEWPVNDGSTVVIELSTRHPLQNHIKELGYRVLTESDLQIGVLQRSVDKWSRQHVDPAVIRDAVEEYLGV